MWIISSPGNWEQIVVGRLRTREEGVSERRLKDPGGSRYREQEVCILPSLEK